MDQEIEEYYWEQFLEHEWPNIALENDFDLNDVYKQDTYFELYLEELK